MIGVVVNGKKYEFRDPKDLILFLLRIIRVEHSSLDAMKESIILILETFQEACIESRRNEKLTSGQKSALTRMIRRTERQVRWWRAVDSVQRFQFKYFDFILALEGLRTLHGFSTEASIEIGGKGSNPEKKSIYRRLHV